MLALMAGSVVVNGGGPEGWSWDSLNPLSAFGNVAESITNPTTGVTVVAAGSAV